MENFDLAIDLKTDETWIIEGLHMSGKVSAHRGGVPNYLQDCMDEFCDAPLPRETLVLTKAQFNERFGECEMINIWDHLECNRAIDLGCNYRIVVEAADDSEFCSKYFLKKNGE